MLQEPHDRELVPAEPVTPREAALKILLVEDNPADAHFVRIALRSQPLSLREVATLADGLRALRAERFDVVLLDLALPDSLGLVTFVQVHARFRRIPVVVLSGLDDEKTAVSAVRLGAQDFLVKGTYDEESLRRAILYAVERQAMLGHFMRSLAWARRELGRTTERMLGAEAAPREGTKFCASCGRIREGERAWMIHEYLATLNEETCPECRSLHDDIDVPE